MSTQYITRRSTALPGAAAKANAAPIYVDTDDGKLKLIPGGAGSTTEVEIHTTDQSNKTTVNIGAVNGATVSAVEYGNGFLHQTIITLTALPLTLADATVGAGVKIYDFPEGVITIVGASGSVAETTTSAIASTLNSGITYNWGVGTTTQASATLATTEQDIIPVTNGVSSATINVAAAVSKAARVAAPANFDGSATAKDAFFNVAIATNTDIDADATTTWTGTLTITWILNGDT